MLRLRLILKLWRSMRYIIDDNETCSMTAFVRVRFIQLGFFNSSGKIQADMEAWREVLVITNSLELGRRLECAGVTF